MDHIHNCDCYFFFSLTPRPQHINGLMQKDGVSSGVTSLLHQAIDARCCENMNVHLPTYKKEMSEMYIWVSVVKFGWHLRVADLQTSCNGLTWMRERQDSRLSVMVVGRQALLMVPTQWQFKGEIFESDVIDLFLKVTIQHVQRRITEIFWMQHVCCNWSFYPRDQIFLFFTLEGFSRTEMP